MTAHILDETIKREKQGAMTDDDIIELSRYYGEVLALINQHPDFMIVREGVAGRYTAMRGIAWSRGLQDKVD